MNSEDRQLYDLIRQTCEDHARLQLAKKLQSMLPIHDRCSLVSLIGTPNDLSNLDALQTWIKEVMDYAPKSCLELTLDHWFQRLLHDLMYRLSQRGESHA